MTESWGSLTALGITLHETGTALQSLMGPRVACLLVRNTSEAQLSALVDSYGRSHPQRQSQEMGPIVFDSVGQYCGR